MQTNNTDTARHARNVRFTPKRAYAAQKGMMGMDPNQTSEQAALIKELERSARAELRLRTMALEYAKGELLPIVNRECGTRLILVGGRPIRCRATPRSLNAPQCGAQ